MWMWSLQNPPFLGAISPRLSLSAVRLRTRWLQGRSQSQEPEAKATMGSSTTGVPASAQRRQRKTSRDIRLVAQSAASFPITPTSANVSGSDQELAVDLDYAPALGPFREVLCVLAPVLLVALLYVATAQWHGGSWPANVATAVLAAALASLARTALLERAYKARERAFAALGDGDSHFRPITTTSTTAAATVAAAAGGRRLEPQVVVHVKVKVGDLTQPSPYDGGSGGDGTGMDADGATDGGRSSAAVGAPVGQAAGRARDSIPAVHCYHGFGANLGSYKRVQDELAAVLRGVVTAHDMPGFGLTERPADISSYFLNFNGRLGRLVMDYELQQLGLPLAPGPAGQQQQGAGEQQLGAGTVAGSASASADGGGVSGAVVMTVRSREDGGGGRSRANGQGQELQQEGAVKARLGSAGAGGGIKRILVGHSLGGACASLEAVTHPEGLAGIVLVAPAVVALPGHEYQNVTLSPDRPAAAVASSAAAAAAAANAAEQLRTAAARAAAQLGSEPPGSHVTDPPEVRRLYPVGQMPAGPVRSGGGDGGASEGGEGKTGARGRGSRLGALLRAARSLLVAAASLALLVVLRLLTPVITLLLRSLVRRRTFWIKGLQQAYYNPGAVTQDIVDSYRLPQLVNGWEAGMVNFLLARLSRPRPRADLRDLFRQAAKQVQPATTASVLAATAAAATADAKTAAAKVLNPSSPAGEGQDPSPAAAPATQSDTTSSSSSKAAASADSDSDDGDLASRLAALVTSRGLPVLIIHGLYDRLVPASNSQRLARMLPGCELVLLDRCGHMPQEELPQIFVSLVAEFAARLTPTPAPTEGRDV